MTELLYDPDRLAAALTEAGLDALVVTTAPNVRYQVLTTDGESLAIENPSAMPNAGDIRQILEPFVHVEVGDR